MLATVHINYYANYILFANIMNIFHFRREDCIDAEVRASGFTRQMEKDLLREMGVDEDEDEEEEDEDEDDDEENSSEETYRDCSENIEDLKDQISDLQLQVENAVKESFDVSARRTVLNNDNKRTEKQSNIENECERDNTNATVEAIETDKEDNEDELSDASSKNAESNIRKAYIADYDDRQSIRSVSTTATISPDVIKRRTKLALEKRDKKNHSKRILVKGEASAVTRARRDNRAVIQESTGIWGWE